MIADVPVPRLDRGSPEDVLFSHQVVDCVQEIRDRLSALATAEPRQVEQRQQQIGEARRRLSDLFATRWNLEPDRYDELGDGLSRDGAVY